MNNVRDARETMNNVRDANETMNNVRNASETMNNVRDASETVNNVHDASETMNKARDARETMNNVRDASETMNNVRDASETMNNVHDASETMNNVRDANHHQACATRKNLGRTCNDVYYEITNPQKHHEECSRQKIVASRRCFFTRCPVEAGEQQHVLIESFFDRRKAKGLQSSTPHRWGTEQSEESREQRTAMNSQGSRLLHSLSTRVASKGVGVCYCPGRKSQEVGGQRQTAPVHS